MLPFATVWMDLEGIMLSEISKGKMHILYGITCVGSKKYSNLVNITKRKQTFTENKLMVSSGEKARGGAS